MEDMESVLIFEKYVVNKVEFIRNENYDLNQKTKIKFDLDKEVKRKDNKMEVILKSKIFENAQENNYPFEMNIVITGFFSLEGKTEINFEPNAIAILYPYIRAIVSTYTAAANVNPLILPPINVNKYLENKNKKDS